MVSFLLVNVIYTEQRTCKGGNLTKANETNPPTESTAAVNSWMSSRMTYPLSSTARMLSIVRIAFDHPVPCLHGLLTTGEILLRKEGLLVSGDLGQIFLALIHHLRHRREADACEQLILRRGCCAFGFLAEVEAVTLVTLRGGYAVRTQQHFGTAVLTILTGFTQCTGYTINTGAPFYMCHVMSATLYLLPT